MKYLPNIEHLSIRLSRLGRMESVISKDVYSSLLSSSECQLKSLEILDEFNESIILPDYLNLPYLKNLTLGSLTMFDVQKIIQSASKLRYFKFYLNSEQSNFRTEQNIQTNIIGL